MSGRIFYTVLASLASFTILGITFMVTNTPSHPPTLKECVASLRQ